jgi:hypothetical protein
MADLKDLGTPQSIQDPVCAAGAHHRYKAAYVRATYDALGEVVSMEVHGSTVARKLKDRIANALRQGSREEVPEELLDKNKELSLAWNVYVDDYTMCRLFGKRENGKVAAPYFRSYVVGYVELDGVY